MLSLLRLFSFRHAAKHPLRFLLGAAAIALGVALFVSIDIANSTVARSFEQSVDDMAGKAEFQVTMAGGTGIDAAALPKVTSLPGVIAAPVIQRSISFADFKEGTVMVLGIDFVRDSPLRMYKVDAKGQDPQEFIATAFVPNGIIVTRRFAERNRLAKGSPLTADTPRGRARLLVTGILEDEGPARALGGNFAIMSLSAAQSLFGMPGRFDRIEVAPDGITREELKSRLAAALGPGYDIRRLSRKNTSVEVALGRIRAMVVISAIALVVGLFIIYNSVSISVVERVREIGILRSLGASRRQILFTVLLEWTAVGLAGSAAGVAGGYALARFLVDLTAQSANMLTFAVHVSEVVFTWKGAAVAAAAGTLSALAAAFLPGLEAMKIAPVDLLRRGGWQARTAPRYVRSFLAGLALMAATSLVLLLGSNALHPYVLLALTTVAFVAIALCGPQITLWLGRFARPALRSLFHTEGDLAAVDLARFPQRTALTVVAFGGAIAMMVASSTLVGSMKTASERWMKDAFPFDLSVNATDLSTAIYSSAAYPEEVLELTRRVKGVEAAYGVKAAFVLYYGIDIMIVAVDSEEYFAMHRARGENETVRKFDTAEARALIQSGEQVWVSENFAALDGTGAGDKVELPTPDGPRSFTIMAAVEDYSWPAGTILMDRGAYKRIWGDSSLTYTDVRVVPGTPLGEVKSALAAALKDHSTVFVYDVPQLQKVGRDAMDQALALANVQVLIALVIGFLGIVNTLLISVLRRTREIGLLRAVGATRRQIARGVVVESVFIALVGSLVGIASGLAGAAWPMRLFMLKMAGFFLPLTFPFATIAIAVGGSLILGFAASLLPARRAAGLNVLEAIAYE